MFFPYSRTIEFCIIYWQSQKALTSFHFHISSSIYKWYMTCLDSQFSKMSASLPFWIIGVCHSVTDHFAYFHVDLWLCSNSNKLLSPSWYGTRVVTKCLLEFGRRTLGKGQQAVSRLHWYNNSTPEPYESV